MNYNVNNTPVGFSNGINLIKLLYIWTILRVKNRMVRLVTFCQDYVFLSPFNNLVFVEYRIRQFILGFACKNKKKTRRASAIFRLIDLSGLISCFKSRKV